MKLVKDKVCDGAYQRITNKRRKVIAYGAYVYVYWQVRNPVRDKFQNI